MSNITSVLYAAYNAGINDMVMPVKLWTYMIHKDNSLKICPFTVRTYKKTQNFGDSENNKV